MKEWIRFFGAVGIGVGVLVGWTGGARAEDEAATTRPVAATQEAAGLLQAEINRAVEMGQRAVRGPKVKVAPPKNTLQKVEEVRPPDPLVPVAEGLVGKSGLIGFRVVDVVPREGLHFLFGLGGQWLNDKFTLPYLVVVDLENPTAVVFSVEEQRMMRDAKAKGKAGEGEGVRAGAERRKPLHRLVIETDDAAVKDWEKGSRHSLRGTVIGAWLERVPPTPYLRANVAVRAEGSAGAEGRGTE